MPRALIAPAAEQVAFQECESPPLAEGQVRVKSLYAAAKHGTEMSMFKGYAGPRGRFDSERRIFDYQGEGVQYPVPLGNMGVGEVVELGPGVTQLKEGDRIFSYGPFREEHVWQLNMYRWLVQDGQDLVTGERVAYDIQQLGIVYLAPNEVYKRRVPLLPPEQVERFVAERGGAILQALDGEALPPRAWDPHSHPICRGWCPVRQQCLDAGEDGTGEFALDGEALQEHAAPGR